LKDSPALWRNVEDACRDAEAKAASREEEESVAPLLKAAQDRGILAQVREAEAGGNLETAVKLLILVEGHDEHRQRLVQRMHERERQQMRRRAFDQAASAARADVAALTLWKLAGNYADTPADVDEARSQIEALSGDKR